MNIRVIFKWFLVAACGAFLLCSGISRKMWLIAWRISEIGSSAAISETFNCFQVKPRLRKLIWNPGESLLLSRTAPKVCFILLQRNNRRKKYENETECILKMHIRPHYITIIVFHSWHDPYVEWKNFMFCCVPFVFAAVIGFVAYMFFINVRN